VVSDQGQPLAGPFATEWEANDVSDYLYESGRSTSEYQALGSRIPYQEPQRTEFKGTANPWGDLPTRQEQADFRGRGIPSGGFGNISANVKGDIKDLGGFLNTGAQSLYDRANIGLGNLYERGNIKLGEVYDRGNVRLGEALDQGNERLGEIYDKGIPDISKKFQGFLSRVSDSPIADYASSIFQARTEAGVGADVGPTALYNAISSAEFRGTDPSFIRTRHSKAKGGSTAYGPVQITSTLMGEKRGELNLTPDEDKYVDKFLEQGRRFNKYGNKPDLPGYDPKYDYGGAGDLTSEQDQELYRSVAEKLINLMWREKDEDIESFLERWRGVPRQQDEDYYKAFDKSL